MLIPIAALALALSTSGAVPATPPLTREIVAWNEAVFVAAEAEDRFLTLKGLRTAAMMHLAIHDALNAIEPRFEAWIANEAVPSADPRSAVVAAAHAVASSQYPDLSPRWDRLRADALGALPSGPSREIGMRLGDACARRVVESRRGDGWDGEAEYRWHPMAPGVYAEFNEHSATPEGFVFGAGWAEARPFVLERPGRFRVPPPPAITSETYTRAFREVKAAGAAESCERTADQTHLALWWKEFVESSHNRLARELTLADGLDPWVAARLFALLELALYDTYLDVFENKFHYNHWRPYTAVRWASHDGNPDTGEDPSWDNLHHHTYAFPSYPSAHGAACAAAAEVLSAVFGADRPVTITIPFVDRAGPLSEKIAMDPAERSFPSFTAAADECGASRVYLGIHFRYDSTAGVALGHTVGRHVLESVLRRR